jgi:hypothetical protein
MAQHQDLCLLPTLRPTQQHEPIEWPTEAQSMRSRRRSFLLARHRLASGEAA